MRHGERVSAYVAMCEQRADIGDVGEITRFPEAIAEERGDQDSSDGEERLCAAEPFLREGRLLAFRAAAFFDSPAIWRARSMSRGVHAGKV